MAVANTLQRRMAHKVVQEVGVLWEVHKAEANPREQGRYTSLLVLDGLAECYAHLSSQGTYGKDTLRPVTILQVLNASQPHPDADFSIDGTEITQVQPPSLLPPSSFITTDLVTQPNR